MIDLTELAQTVRQHRKQKGLTQVQLAKQAGVSRALIAQLEGERLAEIGTRKLMRILQAVGLDLRVTTLNLNRPTFEDLLQEEEESQPR